MLVVVDQAFVAVVSLSGVASLLWLLLEISEVDLEVELGVVVVGILCFLQTHSIGQWRG